MIRSTDGEGHSVFYEHNAVNLLSAVKDAEGFRETMRNAMRDEMTFQNMDIPVANQLRKWYEEPMIKIIRKGLLYGKTNKFLPM